MKYHWPGNVRELQHCIERAVILADHSEIDEHNLALQTHDSQQSQLSSGTLEEMEKQMIIATIESENGIFDGSIQLYVHDTQHLEKLAKKLENIEGVEEVARFDVH